MKNNRFRSGIMRGFSVSVSSKLIFTILIICKNIFLEPLFNRLFSLIRNDFQNDVHEFKDKLSPLVLNKILYKKRLLGAKITFYYED